MLETLNVDPKGVIYFPTKGFFQAVWFTTVYRMKIEFRINLIQFHPKPPRPPMVCTENFSPHKRIYGKKKEVVSSMHYALRVVTAGTVFSSNMNLSKNKNRR